MEKIPISAVWPLQDGVLQIIFETGSTAVVNFQTKFQTARFGPLRENSSAGTGTVSRWWRWPATSCWA